MPASDVVADGQFEAYERAVGFVALHGDGAANQLEFLAERDQHVDAAIAIAIFAGVTALYVEAATIVSGIGDLAFAVHNDNGHVEVARVRLDGTADQETFGGIDMTVRRNAFGRQVHSFEGDLAFDGFDSPVHAVFIRAPWVERLGEGVEALATIPSGEAVGRIVAVREGHLMATSFHPEVGADDRVHRYFVELVKQS